MVKQKKLWVTGANGMVGQAILRKCSKDKKYEVLATTKNDFDQTNQLNTFKWLDKNKPDIVIMTSALVGGIQLNSKLPADFLYQNSMINLNIINAANEVGCKKIIFLGASCMYPKKAKQPFEEKSIMKGNIEETNEGYGVAKIVGLKMIQMLNQQFKTKHLTIIPAASYGPNDCYDLSKNHVIPALIKKIHSAKMQNKKEVFLWGTGNVKREFIHVDDMVDGIFHIIKNYKETEPINLGSGEEITIKKLSKIISKIISYQGKISFDASKPDGVKRKILDNKKIKRLRWKPKITLENGIYNIYKNLIKNNLL